MVGAVIVLVVLVIVGPVAVMVAGAIWSALMGQLHADDADARAAAGGTELSADG
jgi:hypothetical protein